MSRIDRTRHRSVSLSGPPSSIKRDSGKACDLDVLLIKEQEETPVRLTVSLTALSQEALRNLAFTKSNDLSESDDDDHYGDQNVKSSNDNCNSNDHGGKNNDNLDEIIEDEDEDDGGDEDIDALSFIGPQTSGGVLPNLSASVTPQQEIEILRKQNMAQKQVIDKLLKTNQMLTDECEALKRMLQEQPSRLIEVTPAPPPKSTAAGRLRTNSYAPGVALTRESSGNFSVVKVGYLSKRGYNWHNWCTRWCILRWNTLTYYKSPSDTKPRGMFPIQGCNISEVTIDPKKFNTFAVESRERTWYFQASSPNELKSWINALKMTVDGSAHAAEQTTATISRSDKTGLSILPANKTRKILQFFGEAPTKDWLEKKHKNSQARFHRNVGPVPDEIAGFVSVKEAKLMDECGLTILQVHPHYIIFLNSCYFITRDKELKQRAREFVEKGLAKTQHTNAATVMLKSMDPSNALAPRHKSRYASSMMNIDINSMLIQSNPRDVYTFIEKIGKGGFSTVYLAKNKKTKASVAIKVFSQKFGNDAKMFNEIALLASINHPDIITYIESYLFNDEVYLVTEYYDTGSLETLLRGEPTESVIAHVLQRVLFGLKFLHSKQIVHRDIKMTNILLDSKGAVKIADLGLCEEVRLGRHGDKMSGSRYWLPPEVVGRAPYGEAVDVWNVGVLGFTLANKNTPYGDCHPIKALYLVGTQGVSVSSQLTNGPKKEWSTKFKDFLSRCFTFDPTKRPSVAELLDHPFIVSACPKQDLIATIKSCLIEDFLIS